jgi:hypothetical protein
MKRGIPVVLSTLLLGGCALPVHVQVLSWAIDGFSYLTTDKSVTDHGLSMVVEKDCALWRLITEGEICRDEDAITTIAAADITLVDEGTEPEVDAISTSSASWDNPATAEELSVIEVSVMELDASVIETVPPRKPGLIEPVALTVTTVGTEPYMEMASAGDYLVIGSFAKQDNAKGFAKKNGIFDTKILPAVVAGNQVYRVVVGPVAGDNRSTITSSLEVAGHVETWPLRVPDAQTTIAWRTVPAKLAEPSTQLATLPGSIQ